MAKGPGKHYREGVTMMAIADMFSTDDKATQWFESWMWPGGEIVCMKCGSLDAYRVKSRKPMPYRCRDCRQYFSLKTCTAMEDSKLPLRLWGWAIYLEMTNLKGVSSMKLSRDLGIRQATAWHMLHRIREAFSDIASHFEGPVEVDETYVGGQRKNMSNAKRRELAGTGRGTVGKTAVVGAKDRATNMVTAHVVQRTDRDTLQGFVKSHTRSGAKIYTDEASCLRWAPEPRDGQALGRGVRPRLGAHQRRRELLGDAQAWLPRGLSPNEREAPATLRQRVRGPSQHPRNGHPRTDPARRRRDGRAAPHVPGPRGGLTALNVRGSGSL